MMVRIRTIAVALSLCTAAVAPVAGAQVVAEHPVAGAQVVAEHPARTVAPPAAPLRVEDADSLEAPPAPEVPDDLRDRVASMARVVEDTAECFTYHGERVEHIADRRCGSWYATLQRGGPAAAHAIGRALTATRAGTPGDDGFEGEEQRGPRLVQVLAATGAPEAVPYLLRHLASAAQRHRSLWDTDREVLRQLARLAGDDPAPVAPWESDPYSGTESRRHSAAAWLRWWREHEHDTPAQRAAAGEARALSDLSADDPARRYAAMVRLANHPAHRPVVTASLRELLGRSDLPARASVYLRRWAQRARIPVTAPPPAARSLAAAL